MNPSPNSNLSMEELIASYRQRIQQTGTSQESVHEQSRETTRDVTTSSNEIEIYIKNLQGDIKTVSINPNTKISNLKTHIQNSEGVDAKNVRLIYGGKELDDNLELKDYDVKKGATIQWVLRLTGGL